MFVTHHRDLAYGLARRWVSDAADAEDVAQDAFLRAWRALERYDRPRIAELRLRGWLARIVLNLCRNRARDAHPRTDDLDEARHHVDVATATPEQAAVRHESARDWSERLAALPDRQRLAVELRHVHGLSYTEMADALGRPVNTLKSDVHRGIRTLRVSLEALDPHDLEVAP